MKYQICVSGAAKGHSVEQGKDLAFGMGQEIAKAGHVLMSGATIGLPYYAAKGAKSVGGTSIGISPAATRLAHTNKYRLPNDEFDVILYTGSRYVGRDILLIQSSDAVVVVGGRIGTLHEFTGAVEGGKPVGVLMGAGGTSTLIESILETANEPTLMPVIFDTDPARLLKKLVAALNDKYDAASEKQLAIVVDRQRPDAKAEDRDLSELEK